MKLTTRAVSMSVVVMLSLNVSLFTAHAQTIHIDDQLIEQQKQEVSLKIVAVMHEQVKLLQMILIRQLGQRVNQLQTLLDASSK